MFPTLIAIASILPGLGFLIMGKWKSALMTWAALIALSLFFLLTVQIQTRCLDLNLIFVLLLWVTQGVRAYKLAKIMDQIRGGEIAPLIKLDQRTLKMSPKLTAEEKLHFLWGKKLEAQLTPGEPGEAVIAWVVGNSNQRNWLWGDRRFCIGLLREHLLICEFGVFDFPETIRRIRKTEATLTGAKGKDGGLLWVAFDTETGHKKSIIIPINVKYSQILEDFNQKAEVKPLFG